MKVKIKLGDRVKIKPKPHVSNLRGFPHMNDCAGKMGNIIEVDKPNFLVEFESKESWWYELADLSEITIKFD